MISLGVNSEKHKEWISRPYQDGDESGISILFNKTFPHDFKHYDKYWQWEFANNPAGTKSIQLAVSKDGEIVGQYAVTHRNMWINNNVLNVALSLDTMTHVDFRKQGVFTRLALDLYNRLEQQNIPLVYGFPNINSIYGFENKLKWQILGTTPVMVRPIKFEKIFRLSESLMKKSWAKYMARFISADWNVPIYKLLKKCSWSEIYKFDARIDMLWQQIRSEFQIAVDRNAQYLNWRYVDKPDSNYIKIALEDNYFEIMGVLILKLEKFGDLTIGVIADLIARPGFILRTAMINYAVSIFKKFGVDAIIALCVPNTTYFKSFQSNLFFLIPNSLNPVKNYWGVKRNANILSPNIIFDPSRWFITCGDTDLI